MATSTVIVERVSYRQSQGHYWASQHLSQDPASSARLWDYGQVTQPFSAFEFSFENEKTG